MIMENKRNLSTIEQLCFSTIRIEAKNDTSISTGTGFFFNFNIDGKTMPFIVTNKHVVRKMKEGTFFMTEDDGNNFPLYTQHVRITTTDFEDAWLMHPDNNIDLCVMSITYSLNFALEHLHKHLFFKAFEDKLIPSQEQLQDIDIAEDILMIGYPNGLWDSIHNMPIVRRGIMATDINLCHNGKREFVIDAACFPGSSGSPIILYNKGQYSNKHGNINIGQSRMYLLGILWGGPQQTIQGDLKVEVIPTSYQKVYSETQVLINLGYVIQSSVLRDFVPLIKDRYRL